MKLRKIVFILIGNVIFSGASLAEESRSLTLYSVPTKCSAELIFSEIPIVGIGFSLGEVIDVSQVREVEHARNLLTCSAYLELSNEELNGKYDITFRVNSVGSVLVKYDKIF
ncbi:hypothetical protein HPC38_02780 [Pasteurellaceae bacterium HPA106]|uniref:hypothetical protein n=1 Tax=Spirabiliibacterium pneumoniae TaxID=221400 RepID=UPI001AADCEE3|nr:hypothetical protein [Spirabiliibacterium pneumoniae]MBE2895804.1 hypothetical protein [Spirabiliibacterium pneumoniae]